MKGKESGVDGPRQTRAAAVQLYLNGLRNPAESEEPDSYHSYRVCDEIKQNMVITSHVLRQRQHLNIYVLVSARSLVLSDFQKSDEDHSCLLQRAQTRLKTRFAHLFIYSFRPSHMQYYGSE